MLINFCADALRMIEWEMRAVRGDRIVGRFWEEEMSHELNSEETVKVVVTILKSLPKLIAAGKETLKLFQKKKPEISTARYELDRHYGRLREIVLLYQVTRPVHFPTAQADLNHIKDLHALVVKLRDQHVDLKKDPWYNTHADIIPALNYWIDEHNKTTKDFPVEPLKLA